MLKILVADDDPDVQTILTERLNAEGYQATAVADGREALAAVREDIPDVVLLDVEMPRMKGLETLEHIRSDWPELPVILMTAFASVPLAVQAMQEGANDFVQKPIEFEILQSKISKAIARKEFSSEVARLLGDLTHELKNLLQPVVAGTGLLKEEIEELVGRLMPIEAAKAEASHQLCEEIIDMLQRTASKMQDRMKVLADYVKVAGTPCMPGPCRLVNVLDQVLLVLRHLATSHGVTLQCEGLHDLPVILADESLLFTAFFNLVNNAIPEVPSGGTITIRGAMGSEGQTILLTVHDTGRGMPPEMVRTLFKHTVISRKVGGTGLGLRIVKEAVDAHQGSITVSSVQGQGTTFCIRLPIYHLETVTRSA